MIFINCTQHNLNEDQIKVLGNETNIFNLKEINHELFSKLANSPDNKKDMITLANEFIDYMVYMQKNRWRNVTFHLPIGSPAFQYILSGIIHHYNSINELQLRVDFSHTDRISVDNTDGTKTNKFEFKHFIEV
jgi:hypothetical protein